MYLTGVLAEAGLLVFLLLLAVGAQPAAHADGDILKVPDDYPTIQAAIDAATDGDTILVATGRYEERLFIAKGITLTGGWDPTFSARRQATAQSTARAWAGSSASPAPPATPRLP